MRTMMKPAQSQVQVYEAGRLSFSLFLFSSSAPSVGQSILPAPRPTGRSAASAARQNQTDLHLRSGADLNLRVL